MSKTLPPYTFPARSRAAMVTYILGRDSRSYDYKTRLFCWNVKAYIFDFSGDILRGIDAIEFAELDSAFDSDWDSYVESLGDWGQFFHQCCEASAYHLCHGYWTSYHDTDSGDWEFSFSGRSGGWLVLDKFKGRNVDSLYSDPQEVKKARRDGWNLSDDNNLDSWDFETLRAFYRGLRCADSDFTSVKASKEVLYQAALCRESWEDEKRVERSAAAAALVSELESDRPDLYAVTA
jgi:hypothetical protein